MARSDVLGPIASDPGLICRLTEVVVIDTGNMKMRFDAFTFKCVTRITPGPRRCVYVVRRINPTAPKLAISWPPCLCGGPIPEAFPDK